ATRRAGGGGSLKPAGAREGAEPADARARGEEGRGQREVGHHVRQEERPPREPEVAFPATGQGDPGRQEVEQGGEDQPGNRQVEGDLPEGVEPGAGGGGAAPG